MAALHHDASLPHRRPRLTVPSRNSRPAASVKKIEPAKKTALSAPGPTSCAKPGNGPMKKHAARPRIRRRSSAPRPAGWPAAGPTPARDLSGPHLEHGVDVTAALEAGYSKSAEPRRRAGPRGPPPARGRTRSPAG